VEKTHDEKPNDLYSSPIVVWVIKSRTMRRVGHVVHMGAGRGIYRVLVGETLGKGTIGETQV
jgi:hypothetical protein